MFSPLPELHPVHYRQVERLLPASRCNRRLFSWFQPGLSLIHIFTYTDIRSPDVITYADIFRYFDYHEAYIFCSGNYHVYWYPQPSCYHVCWYLPVRWLSRRWYLFGFYFVSDILSVGMHHCIIFFDMGLDVICGSEINNFSFLALFILCFYYWYWFGIGALAEECWWMVTWCCQQADGMGGVYGYMILRLCWRRVSAWFGLIWGNGRWDVIPKVNNVPYFTYRTLNFLEKEKMLRSNIVTEINFDI